MSTSVEKFLESKGLRPSVVKHVGVVGMKWGQRKSRSSKVSSPDSARAAKVSVAGKQNTFSSKPSNKKMTDAQLRQKINRLDMEKRYKELTTPAPKGKSFAKQLLADQGKAVARTLATRAVSVALQLALEKAATSATGPNKALLEGMAAAGKGKKKKD